MKKKIFILSLAILALGSCKKKGCTDSDATNYNADAGKDDNSCTFEGDVVFYYTQTTYLNDLLPNGYTGLGYYIDGTLVGNKTSDNSWTGSGVPDCSVMTLMTTTLDMAGQKSRLYTYEVKDNASGTVVFSGSQVIDANTCNPILLQ